MSNVGEALQGGPDGLRRAACRRPARGPAHKPFSTWEGKSSDSLRDVPEESSRGRRRGSRGCRSRAVCAVDPAGAQGGLRATGRRGGTWQPACDSHAAARFLSHMMLDLGTWAPGPVLVLSPALVVSITRQFLYAQQRRAGKAALCSSVTQL